MSHAYYHNKYHNTENTLFFRKKMVVEFIILNFDGPVLTNMLECCDLCTELSVGQVAEGKGNRTEQDSVSLGQGGLSKSIWVW